MCLHILVMTLANVIGHPRATPGKDTVDIINWMPNGDDLTVHCRSGKDDHVVHVVPHNVDYNWRPTGSMSPIGGSGVQSRLPNSWSLGNDQRFARTRPRLPYETVTE